MLHHSFSRSRTNIYYTIILVRNQNEELMNSLDREEFGPSENSTEDIMYR
jgi:hypothetical protein